MFIERSNIDVCANFLIKRRKFYNEIGLYMALIIFFNKLGLSLDDLEERDIYYNIRDKGNHMEFINTIKLIRHFDGLGLVKYYLDICRKSGISVMPILGYGINHGFFDIY